jgi:hypothetical protein
MAEAVSLRDLIEAALDASIDKCARCKVCGNQVDAVLAVITGGPPGGPPELGQLLARADRLLELAGEMAGLSAQAQAWQISLTEAQPRLNDLAAEAGKMKALVQQAYDLGTRAPLTGADFTDGAYDGEESCGCGEPIAWFEGEWMHILSEELRGSGDHTAEPAGGFYIPDGMEEVE